MSLITFNALLLCAVAGFVLLNQKSSGSAQTPALSSQQTSSSDSVANPLDQVSSADIAVNIARMSSLPESVAVTNQADSVTAEMTAPPVDSSIAAKPQVVSTALPSRKDIFNYVVQQGDTVASIAAKFNVSSDSIRWSNSLAGNTVNAGQTLVMPPKGVSGIVYTVKAGDTPDSLAAKYKANKDEIVDYNDAEIAGLQPGERIIIANGRIDAPVVTYASSGSGFSFGSSPVYGSNGYIYGYCTWYVATRIAVPANWGNANTWDNAAAISGWTVSTIPRVGAIGQTDRGSEGHVAVIEAVSDDGTMIKYADMNGLAGWGRVGRTPDFVSASKFEHYIYR